MTHDHVVMMATNNNSKRGDEGAASSVSSLLSSRSERKEIQFEITGTAAHNRIAPLLPPTWIDCSPSAATLRTKTASIHYDDVIHSPTNVAFEVLDNSSSVSDCFHPAATVAACAPTTTTTAPPAIDFLWENSHSKHSSKSYRDSVKCYSHLPNGQILDDKWALARFMMSRRRRKRAPSDLEDASRNGMSDGECMGAAGAAAIPSSLSERRKDETNSFINSNDCHHGSTTIEEEGEDTLLAILETHCFRGLKGFLKFSSRVGGGFLHDDHDTYLQEQGATRNDETTSTTTTTNVSHAFLDITDISKMICSWKKQNDFDASNNCIKSYPILELSNTVGIPKQKQSLSLLKNWWVIKDANANGAGGIWILSPSNMQNIISSSRKQEMIHHDDQDNEEQLLYSTNTSLLLPLIPSHRYVAQKYAFPPIIYHNRKFHIRVYGLITANQCIYVHRQCFLHVANKEFNISYQGNVDHDDEKEEHDSCVHITNCCANSHDDTKFTGELCAVLTKPEISDDNEDISTNSNTENEQNNEIDLSPFFPSICASMQRFMESSWPFIDGGDHVTNGGFEYLGLDFMLSYKLETPQSPASCSPISSSDSYSRLDHNLNQYNGLNTKKRSTTTNNANDTTTIIIPIAYLLEVNAPPSQDTATGLPHAERLHNTVINDLIHLWVLPRVCNTAPKVGGWKLVCHNNNNNNNRSKRKSNEHDIECTSDGSEGESLPLSSTTPSKAGLLNKMRWTIFELKCVKLYEEHWEKVERARRSLCTDDAIASVTRRRRQHREVELIVKFARSCFPYFASELKNPVFFENAGGSQVPRVVIDAVANSLSMRNRSVVGAQSKASARETFHLLLGAPKATHEILLGANATCLLQGLAQIYSSGNFLSSEDEIVIAEHNHEAHCSPWLMLARHTGARVRWWKCSPLFDVQQENDWALPSTPHRGERATLPPYIQEFLKVLNPKTRIVTASHASNVLGYLYDIKMITEHTKRVTNDRAHVIIDGVAAVPHRFAAMKYNNVDWYVVSSHKMFGPHIACLCGKTSSISELQQSLHLCESAGWHTEDSCKDFRHWIERGTISYEACAGVNSIIAYFSQLASHRRCKGLENDDITEISTCEQACIMEAYQRIKMVESSLVVSLLTFLNNNPKVIVVEEPARHDERRLPVVSFYHAKIKPCEMVEWCKRNNIICRHGFFLSERVVRNVHASLAMIDFGVAAAIRNVGVFRISLLHYNSENEVRRLKDVLLSMHDWA